MTKKKATGQPLRGEDAYLANKRAIAARNDAARNRLEAERAPKNRKEAKQRRENEIQEMANLPTQPTPPEAA
jgi:RNA processing factor Prp31